MAKIVCRHSGSLIDSLSLFPHSQRRVWEKIPVLMTSVHKSDIQIVENMVLWTKVREDGPNLNILFNFFLRLGFTLISLTYEENCIFSF